MNEQNLMVNADFLSIALEEMDGRSYVSAREFADDVRVNLLNAGREAQSETLQDGIDCIDNGEYEKATEYFGEVYDELLEEL